MKKIMAMLLSLAMLMTCALVAAEDAEPEVEPVQLNISAGVEPGTLDPTLSAELDGAMLLQHIFEGLYKWVDDGEGKATLALGQAASVEKSGDGLTYTFTLRDDAVWSDGGPVTAQDFEYAWRRLANPETSAPYAYIIDMVAGYADVASGAKAPDTLGARAIDEKTFEVTLHTPCAYFEEICAFPTTFPVREDIISAQGEKWIYDPVTFVSNGPYSVMDWVHNGYIDLDKNEKYYDAGKLGVDILRFYLLDDEILTYTGYETNELDFLASLPADEVGDVMDEGVLTPVESLGVRYILFNAQGDPFSSPDVRKALSLAMDRQTIVQWVTQSGQIPADALVPSGLADAEGNDFRTVGGSFYDPTAHDANCEEARRLLADAGFPEGKGFPEVEFLYAAGDMTHTLAKEIAKMWLNELGITVTLRQETSIAFYDLCRTGDYTLALADWTADYSDPLTFLDIWATGGGNNLAHYSNPALDETLATLKTTSEPGARAELLHQAETIIMDDTAVAPIYFHANSYLSKGFDGMYSSPLGYYFFSHVDSNTVK